MPYPQDSRQWMLDELEGSGLPYEAGLVDGKAVLRSLEQYGDYRRPRGKKCYLADGVDSYINLPDETPFQITGDYTITGWIKCADYATDFTNSALFARWNSATGFMLLGNNGSLRIYRDSEQIITDTAVMDGYDGQWIHLACTVAGTTGEILINGSVVKTGTFGSATQGIATNVTVAIGTYGSVIPAPAGFKIDGYLRDVRIYNVSKSPAEIASIANGFNDTTGLVAKYSCNEESGTTAFNSASGGGALDGVITNANLTTFHAVDDGVLSNPANDVGFTDNAGVIVPRDESAPTLDVQGNPLQYSGRCPLPAATETPVGTFVLDDYIIVPHNAAFDTAVFSITGFVRSIGAWTGGYATFYRTASNGGTGFFALGGKLQLLSLITGSTTMNPDQWYHVAVTSDGATLNLYLDGQSDAAPVSAVADLTNPADKVINDVFNNFTGLIESLQFWGVGLDAAEVQYLATLGKSGIQPDPANLVADWPITEGEGNTVYDVANAPGPAQNNGTIINANLVDFWANRTDAARDHAVEYGGGRVGGFNGTDAKVQIPSPIITGTGDFSLAFRFKGVSGSLIATFAGANASGLQVYVTTGLNSYIGGVVGGATPVNDGEWYFGTVVRSSGTTTIYIDGAVDGSGAQAAAIGGAVDMAFGARPDNLEWYTGNIADVRAYDDSLTPDEITFLQTSGNSGTDPTKDNLVGEWLLSGNAKDSSGNGNDGTESGGVTYPFIPGLLDGSAAANGSPLTLLPNRFSNPKARINTDPWASPELAPINAETDYAPGNARQSVSPINTKFRASGLSGSRHYDQPENQGHRVTDPVSLRTGDIDFTVAGWVYFDGFLSDRVVTAKLESSGAGEWTLDSTGTSIRLRIFNASVNVGSVTWPEVLLVGQWYFVVAGHDSVADTVSISLNNGPAQSAASSPPAPTNIGFAISGYANGSQVFDGRIANVGFWKRTLTTDERTALYNAGEGLNSNQLSDALKTNLISYWNLDEPNGGDAQDLIGTNTLTAVNGPTSIAGPDQSTEGDDRMLAAWRTATQEDWGSFNGVDNYVAFSVPQLSATSDFTILVTVNAFLDLDSLQVVSLEGDVGFARIDRGARIYEGYVNDGANHSVQDDTTRIDEIASLQWSRSGTTYEFLVNDVSRGTIQANNPNPASGITALGSRTGTSGFVPFDMYDVKIYNSGTELIPANLILHYDFSDQSGTTLTDLSGTGNDGTLLGDASAFWQSGLVNPPSLGLVGQDLQDVIAYVERQQLGPTFLPAWANQATQVIQLAGQ